MEKSMARQIFNPRKQRTRQHVIADLSIHHVEGFILEEGHTVQQIYRDYGYDLLMFTYDERGFAEPGFVSIQFKASEALESIGDHYVFDLDVRDYHLWIKEKMPVILILFDAGRSQAFWLSVQDYFQADILRFPRKGAKSVRVRVPMGQAVDNNAVRHFRDLKQAMYDRAEGADE